MQASEVFENKVVDLVTHSRFAFTLAYTWSSRLLEGVSMVKILFIQEPSTTDLALSHTFLQTLHAFNRFSLSAAVRDWTSWCRNTELHIILGNSQSHNWRIAVSLAIHHGLSLVPSCLSWLRIKSLTNLIFESVLTERRRPLPGTLSTLPVESILLTE